MEVMWLSALMLEYEYSVGSIFFLSLHYVLGVVCSKLF